MKKILLIIIIVFCIFQLIVLATVIEVGPEAINRTGTVPDDYTYVDNYYPANATGTITTVEIWAANNMTDCEVATFFVVSGNNLTTRDDEYIGNVAAGAKRTFTVDLEVEAGDYIGITFNTGDLEQTAHSGTGINKWYQIGDKIPCTNMIFTLQTEKEISIHGIGATEEEEEDNAIFFGFNF